MFSLVPRPDQDGSVGASALGVGVPVLTSLSSICRLFLVPLSPLLLADKRVRENHSHHQQRLTRMMGSAVSEIYTWVYQFYHSQMDKDMTFSVLNPEPR